jgi:hypothetical protein
MPQNAHKSPLVRLSLDQEIEFMDRRTTELLARLVITPASPLPAAAQLYLEINMYRGLCLPHKP